MVWQQVAYGRFVGTEQEIRWVHRIWHDHGDGLRETEFDNKYHSTDVVNGRLMVIRYQLERNN